MRLPCLWAPALAATLACVYGQTSDLTSLSLEEFMKLEVTSVSKSTQKLVRTPAAVCVITREDIRRSGAAVLPDVLRICPGVHVARLGGVTWAVGIRGFSNIYSDKLLMTIDGRTVYSAFYSGVNWHQDLVPLEDIERIEIIRGPGATVWGANAVNGVISITTRNARQTTGGLVAVSGGSFNAVRTTVRYGAEAGDSAAWRGWGQYSRLNHPPLKPGREPGGPLEVGRAGARFDWQSGERDAFVLDGEVHRNRSTVEGIDELGGKAGTVVRNWDHSAHVTGRWIHTTRSGNEIAVRLYVNSDDLFTGQFSARTRTTDLDVQETFRPAARHRLVVGGGLRANLVGTSTAPGVPNVSTGCAYWILNGFVQDEWEVVQDRLMVLAGAKVENYSIAGPSWQPTGRVMWTPTQRQGYWIAVSRAVRTPAHTDYSVRLPVTVSGSPLVFLLMGNPKFRPEELTAYEIGSRYQLGRRMAVDVAAFHNRYQKLHSFVLPTAAEAAQAVTPGARWVFPITTDNALDGINQGVEVSLQYKVRASLHVSGYYSSVFAQTSPRATSRVLFYSIPDYTPEHQGQVRASWDFAKGWSANGTLYRFGKTPAQEMAGYTRLDLNLARRVAEGVELGVSGQHLLRPYQRESATSLLNVARLVPRSFELTLRWVF